MSFIDQTGRKNPTSIAAVVGVHAAVGYALLIGLGYTVIPYVPPHTVIFTVPTESPPPERQRVRTQPSKQPVTNPIPKPEDSFKADETARAQSSEGPIGATDTGGGPIVLPKFEPVRPDQATDALPGKDRLRWITADDYPAAAIRQNVQGVVGISVTIGTDGRVRSCLVTQSSGSQLLDDATCRLYAKRARFTPARDADGNPTTAQRTDRYRWQIPNE